MREPWVEQPFKWVTHKDYEDEKKVKRKKTIDFGDSKKKWNK